MKPILFVITAVFIWCCLMVAVPLFFLHKIEKKYSIVMSGKKSFSLIRPKIKVKDAAFIWNERVELVKGDLEVAVDARAWLFSRIWTLDLKADGSRLRFVGDWQRKTGVSAVQTSRLRIHVDFSDEGIHDIDNIELVAPNYQFQIKSRINPKR